MSDTTEQSTIPKRGRGKPLGTRKANARREEMKLRWMAAELEKIRIASILTGEDVSTFIRTAALAKAAQISNPDMEESN